MPTCKLTKEGCTSPNCLIPVCKAIGRLHIGTMLPIPAKSDKATEAVIRESIGGTSPLFLNFAHNATHNRKFGER